MELSQSQHNTDAQLAVLIRMTVQSHNALVEAFRTTLYNLRDADGTVVLPDDTRKQWTDMIPNRVTFDSINQLFNSWDRFRGRPDFKSHFRAWYMGENLDDLPPVTTELGEHHDDEVSIVPETC